MDPTGPAQPNLDEAYHVPSNPTSKTPSETANPSNNSSSSGPTDTRQAHDISIPRTQTDSNSEGTPSALGQGSDKPDKGESVGRAADELDGEQMRMAGEGDVYQAQLDKGGKGGFGEEQSFTADLDRKKEEQRGMREEIKAERKEKVDVGGALGQRGGVATVEGR